MGSWGEESQSAEILEMSWDGESPGEQLGMVGFRGEKSWDGGLRVWRIPMGSWGELSQGSEILVKVLG